MSFLLKALLNSIVILSFSTVATAFSGECRDVKVIEILVAPKFNGAMIKVNNASCGRSGWVCIAPEKGVTELMSNQILSLAMAAQAGDRLIPLFRWRDESNMKGCIHGFPMIDDFRVI